MSGIQAHTLPQVISYKLERLMIDPMSYRCPSRVYVLKILQQSSATRIYFAFCRRDHRIGQWLLNFLRLLITMDR
jgi:hypothetical protein